MGGPKHPLYGIWRGMIARCTDPENKAFRIYGARGIRVCERWSTFSNFVQDMSPRPSLMHSIDRIDGNMGHEPSNVRWATHTQQMRNRRTNRLISHKGETLPLSVWTERYGLDYQVVLGRIRRGWTLDECVARPARLSTRRLVSDQERRDILAARALGVGPSELARRLGRPRMVIWRLCRGLS